MTFKSIAEFLDPKNGHRPTSAERDLIAKTRTGEPCRCWKGKEPSRPDGPSDDTTIRAALLRLLIIGGTKDCGLHERGVWLEAGWIEGELDLSFCTGKGATLLAYCHFTDRPNLTQTTLPQLSLANSALPGLFAQGAQIAGSLFADEVTAKGTVDVAGAKIGGQLSCAFATLDGGKDEQGTALFALNTGGGGGGRPLPASDHCYGYGVGGQRNNWRAVGLRRCNPERRQGWTWQRIGRPERAGGEGGRKPLPPLSYRLGHGGFERSQDRRADELRQSDLRRRQGRAGHSTEGPERTGGGGRE
jgi:hypothetical protein